MRDSSVSERSATPVPASTRMSLSSSMDVVRRCRPPIPPLQPRIRSFMDQGSSLFLVVHRYSVPCGRRGSPAFLRRFLGIEVVERTPWIHSLQIEKTDFHLVPLTRAVQPYSLVPKLDLVEGLFLQFGLATYRLIDRE